MNEVFMQTVQELSGKTCKVVPLKTPSAVGGVFWAKELADGKPPSASYRANFWQQIRL
jgi:hypothetical protein